MNKVFYARYFCEFSREQLCGQHGTENLAVYGRVAVGLVKVAEGVLVVIRIFGQCITRHPAFLRSGVDGVVIRSMGLFFPVMDVFVITRVSPFRFLIRPGILRRRLCQPLFFQQEFRRFFDDYVVRGYKERILNRTRLIQGCPLTEL